MIPEPPNIKRPNSTEAPLVSREDAAFFEGFDRKYNEGMRRIRELSRYVASIPTRPPVNGQSTPERVASDGNQD